MLVIDLATNEYQLDTYVYPNDVIKFHCQVI